MGRLERSKCVIAIEIFVTFSVQEKFIQYYMWLRFLNKKIRKKCAFGILFSN